MATATRPRAPRLAYADRRRALLDVALQLAESGGSEAVRMDALARAAGVTRPVVYEHFANREALLVALVEEHGRLLGAAPGDEDPASQDFESMLRGAVRGYLAQVVRRGAALRSLVHAAGFSPAVDRAR